ncbi:hypothetical protein [Streptomyces sp. NPDC050485]|uniref:hypothetical protein n=1 Tax=Streptomyces sp. NPDC050485 TaxID=3365617 RepID=UPI00378C09D9
MPQDEITDGVRLRWESDEAATMWSETNEELGTIRHTQDARTTLVERSSTC